MYQILMTLEGGRSQLFADGFKTFEEAQEMCVAYNWVYLADLDGGDSLDAPYEWDLSIVEYEADEDYDINEANEKMYECFYGIETYDDPKDEPSWMR